ncbi:RdgB/HAM1 family non-canonical purine NTP pyrophosphatase [Legionella oakridgensis]|uniref:dITP/XTP pyrophosphatase n=2 Tax=Legionella oakridgensis TaxID=29423 RepID=W0BCE5_9GAMM|nr:RdgB/HAM1 family non-canonical purine NTP pyrophosphatase [Legionella oakridgensis]AHE66277.1 non-canonical purine NTP pyrophosphatase, RdgB/HAM1 family [Legionella oakridgensis ATCC 33761 = DSM 21215]KTD37220.1 deoxyribonucleotide triphosphate pyrophosphatase [Legionella oakridgensis]STY16172.1 ribosomal protein Ham1 [Legionella longbeachae]
MKELILATNNPGKIAEFQALLPSIQCIPQPSLNIPEADETGLSFIENAIIKARHASHLGNKPALADDSGLVVDALHGAPGIYSARFAGSKATSHDNIALLLTRMANIPDEQRSAYFYCTIALVRYPDDPIPLIATGQLFGKITKTPHGQHGFGYDPVFFLNKYNCTIAELSVKIKNEISHRAMALQQLQTQMNNASLLH